VSLVAEPPTSGKREKKFTHLEEGKEEKGGEGSGTIQRKKRRKRRQAWVSAERRGRSIGNSRWSRGFGEKKKVKKALCIKENREGKKWGKKDVPNTRERGRRELYREP